ncbi:hypothetical protein BJ165DRAFT_1486604 [Panaeolus papilionaceus]|nr:hypothetical protein BJ165DRAFT_1486604 [Panaeolus papilionaceus]
MVYCVIITSWKGYSYPRPGVRGRRSMYTSHLDGDKPYLAVLVEGYASRSKDLRRLVFG